MICVSLGNYVAGGLMAVAEKFDFVEFRIDLLKQNLQNIISLLRSGKKSIITYSGSDEDDQKADIINRLLGYSPAFIDIDIKMDLKLVNKLVETAKKSGTKIIFSCHNFEGTPGKKELLDIFMNMINKKPDLIKICTSMKSIEDIYRVSDLYKTESVHKFGKEKLLAFTMGEYSLQSRILSLLNGASFVYTSPDAANPTAEGQPEYKIIKTIAETVGIIKARDSQ